ncbi:ABC transporter ATP-binding protein [Saccharopolyspora hattusasensis]|uniref:ABC transporter ATP-binding protein n=1 Tax=Saccharopolyspora hattusasensis TaxID=1128679 RepID=UPI003D95B657
MPTLTKKTDAPSQKPITVSCAGVRQEYETRRSTVVALDGATLDIKPGEFVSLLGPSGCGKTTLLRLIAGLEAPSRGVVSIDGDEVTSPHPELGVVFQSDLLMPWRTVLDNVLLQADVRRERSVQTRRRALELLAQVGLEGFEDKYPKELSGGMRQRVGICRALLHRPRLMLMDEPFAALDAMTRDQISVDLAEIAYRTEMTVVFVTHSISEAVFLSDRVLVMSARPGRIDTEVAVQLERPRGLHIRQSAEFGRCVGHVTEIFKRLGVLHDRSTAGGADGGTHSEP